MKRSPKDSHSMSRTCANNDLPEDQRTRRNKWTTIPSATVDRIIKVALEEGLEPAALSARFGVTRGNLEAIFLQRGLTQAYDEARYQHGLWDLPRFNRELDTAMARLGVPGSIGRGHAGKVP